MKSAPAHILHRAACKSISRYEKKRERDTDRMYRCICRLSRQITFPNGRESERVGGEGGNETARFGGGAAEEEEEGRGGGERFMRDATQCLFLPRRDTV
jgi:hypothetical protein